MVLALTRLAIELEAFEETFDVERYANIGMARGDLRMKYDVDIREFVILACLCDTGPKSAQQLVDLVDLSPTTTNECLYRLMNNGLIRRAANGSIHYAASTLGISLVQRAALRIHA